MAGIDYDPMGQFIGGFTQGRNNERDRILAQQETDYTRMQQEKEAANKEIQDQIKQVSDILSKTNDPKQREAVLRTLEQAKKVYTGAYYQKLGVDQRAAKMIDFAAQTPFEGQSGGKPSSDPYAATYAREKAKLDAKSAAAAQNADSTGGAKEEYKQQMASAGLADIQTAMDILNEGDSGWAAAMPGNAASGLMGQVLRSVEASPAGRLEAVYSQLRNKEAFKELQRLKDASETGATGLGPIAIKEFEALQQATAKLSTGLPQEDQMRELLKLKTSYENLLDLNKRFEEEQAAMGNIVIPPMDGPIPDEGAASSTAPTEPIITPETMKSAPPTVKRLKFDAQGNRIQ